jgi:hypothetical protein
VDAVACPFQGLADLERLRLSQSIRSGGLATSPSRTLMRETVRGAGGKGYSRLRFSAGSGAYTLELTRTMGPPEYECADSRRVIESMLAEQFGCAVQLPPELPA